MKLKRVIIRNFRSIATLNLSLDPHCQILVGLNESGKSNILKALRLLSDEYEPTPDDRRDPLFDENPIEKSYVWFVFQFDDKDQKKIYDELIKHLLLRRDRKPFIKDKKITLTVKEFCATLSEGLYCIDIIKSEKSASRWAFPKTQAICDGWKAVSDSCPKDYKVVIDDNHTVFLSNYKVVNVEDFPEIPLAYLDELTIEEIERISGPPIVGIVKNSLPACIFWEYSDKNLLPGKIDLAAFAQDPNSFAPLKIMFNLAGIDDIPATVAAENARANGIRNLLNRVANKTTKHIQSIWKEYGGIKIFLAENGPYINAGVQDKFNIYDFARRSDGFKRFITFLLLISAKERTKQLSNTLILIDEPDICLHPSGSKHLRDELIKISSSNYMFFSTHSIFMIDRENISRHLIVTKDKEVTAVMAANTSNIVDEEVIYKALGYSIFESLKQNNIIFEGWRDKNLFRVAMKSKEKRSITKKFVSYGTCHAEGVKDIPRISSLLDLANRKFVIISDDDQVALQYQKQYRGEGRWLRYSEILGSERMTSEDFVKSTILEEALAHIINTNGILKGQALPSLTEDHGRLETIKQWTFSMGVTKEEKERILREFKDRVFSHLEPKHIEEKYFVFLEQLLRAL